MSFSDIVHDSLVLGRVLQFPGWPTWPTELSTLAIHVYARECMLQIVEAFVSEHPEWNIVYMLHDRETKFVAYPTVWVSDCDLGFQWAEENTVD